MAGENISPEERLFKIIREEKASAADPAGKPKRESHAGPGWLVSLKRSLGRMNFFRPMAHASARGHFSLPVKLSDIEPHVINEALVVILAILAAVVVYSIFTGHPGVDMLAKNLPKMTEANPAVGDVRAEPFKAASFYTEEAKKRDIFRLNQPEAVKQQGLFQVPADDLKKKLSDFKLQGITWGHVSKAMIYSEKEGKMYFLKQGDAIGSTGVKIKTILQNKIIVNSGDSEAEII